MTGLEGSFGKNSSVNAYIPIARRLPVGVRSIFTLRDNRILIAQDVEYLRCIKYEVRIVLPTQYRVGEIYISVVYYIQLALWLELF